MARNKQTSRRSRGATPTGLLDEDHSEIKLVPAADREWWGRLSDSAKARFAERHRKKWTDEETLRLLLADPDKDEYYALGAAMGRGPGALRTRRSQMIHLLRDEYEYVAKAKAYIADPKVHHKWADIGQVYRLLGDLGFLDLPVHEQFERARHLKQPSNSWRGDNSAAVERERRATARAVRERLRAARRAAANTNG